MHACLCIQRLYVCVRVCVFVRLQACVITFGGTYETRNDVRQLHKAHVVWRSGCSVVAYLRLWHVIVSCGVAVARTWWRSWRCVEVWFHNGAFVALVSALWQHSLKHKGYLTTCNLVSAVVIMIAFYFHFRFWYVDYSTIWLFQTIPLHRCCDPSLPPFHHTPPSCCY